ncbi:MAG: ATP-grasp fold amidoligase family protein [Vicinamibacterales bacterium]
MASSRATLQQPFERMRGYPSAHRMFQRKLGYALDLKAPRSFNHRLAWKKLYDRNPSLTITADKFAVRDYVQDRLGHEAARRILVPLLYATTDPESIPFETLPSDYVIKANHSSGRNVIVRDGVVNRAAVVSDCKRWLRAPFDAVKGEWAYADIPRKIVVESLLLDETGDIPADYKLFMFGGACAVIQVDVDRFTNHTRSLYDPDWNRLSVTYKYPDGRGASRPACLAAMLEIAEKLSAGFDFVRVDLYVVRDRIYFGEMTHYPECGLGRFDPQSYDFELGRRWPVAGGDR